jgi:glycerophosphoryl diester phosphodiesterase
LTLALLDPAARLVIGHRGASAHAPENTIPSFEHALAAGADAIEFDVHLSADGEPVVIHDPTLARTTDVFGEIERLPLARIQEADAGARFTRDGKNFPFRGQGVRVPTVDEVLARFPTAPMLIELKTPRASAALARVVHRHRAEGRCVIGSFHKAALEIFRAPPWHACGSQAEVQRLLAHLLLWLPLGPVRYEALSIPPEWHGVPLPVRGIARIARARGVAVHIWVVDSPRYARQLWDAGVAGIITNDPAAILAARGGTTK